MRASGTDPFMGTVVLSLLAVLALVLARAAELPWRGVLHWTGEVLLVVGILLAAKGISDVRREWTGLPGMRGRAAQANAGHPVESGLLGLGTMEQVRGEELARQAAWAAPAHEGGHRFRRHHPGTSSMRPPWANWRPS